MNLKVEHQICSDFTSAKHWTFKHDDTLYDILFGSSDYILTEELYKIVWFIDPKTDIEEKECLNKSYQYLIKNWDWEFVCWGKLFSRQMKKPKLDGKAAKRRRRTKDEVQSENCYINT